MSELEIKLTEIRDKIDKLGNDNQRLRSDIQLLENDKVELLNKIENQAKDIEELKNKDQANRIARSVEGNGESQSESQVDLKLKINGLVREIDKCIALLNK